MSTFFGVVLLIIGSSAMIQSFRSYDTSNELEKAGLPQDMLKKSLRNVRILGVICLVSSIYLLFII